MNRLDPHLLFPAARQFDRSSPPPMLVADTDCPLDGVGKALSRRGAPGNTFSMGNGVQIDHYRPALVNNKRAAVIRLEHLDHWTYNLPEVMRILHAFLSEARERPAMLWSHTVCWTDRAVQWYANDIVIDEVKTTHQEHPHGASVALRFEPMSRRRVVVRTDAIRWRRPDGLADSGGPTLSTAKLRAHWDGALGGRGVGYSYGESLGAASEGWREDPLVERGQLPGLRGLVYGLAVDRHGDSQLLHLPLDPGGICLDPIGILDVFLLKAMRLFKQRLSPSQEDVMVDELVFAFDGEGLVAYIAVTSQRFKGWPEKSCWGAHLLDWVRRHCPRGKAR